MSSGRPFGAFLGLSLGFLGAFLERPLTVLLVSFWHHWGVLGASFLDVLWATFGRPWNILGVSLRRPWSVLRVSLGCSLGVLGAFSGRPRGILRPSFGRP